MKLSTRMPGQMLTQCIRPCAQRAVDDFLLLPKRSMFQNNGSHGQVRTPGWRGLATPLPLFLRRIVVLIGRFPSSAQRLITISASDPFERQAPCAGHVRWAVPPRFGQYGLEGLRDSTGSGHRAASSADPKRIAKTRRERTATCHCWSIASTRSTILPKESAVRRAGPTVATRIFAKDISANR